MSIRSPTIRVLLLSNSSKYLTGGPRVLLNMLDSFRRFPDLEPIVLTTKRGPLTDQLEERSIPFLMIPFSGYRSLLFPARLFGLLRKLRPSLVVARNVRMTFFAVDVCRILSIPVIFDVGMEKESKGLIRFFHKRALSHVDKVVVESPLQPMDIFGKELSQTYSSKFRPITPGIPIVRREEIHTISSKKDNGIFRMLFIGSVIPRKDPLTLVEAFAKVKDKQATLSLAGPEPNLEYSKMIRQRVSNLGLADRVNFLGWREDIADLLGQADVYVHAALNEGIPYAIHEALHAGLPIVATRVGGIPDAVKDGENGYLIPPSDHEGFANALNKLVDSPGLREAMGKASAARATENFSVESWARNYRKLIVTVARCRA